MKLLNTITSDEKIARSIEHNRGNQYQRYRVSHALVVAKLALTMRMNELPIEDVEELTTLTRDY